MSTNHTLPHVKEGRATVSCEPDVHFSEVRGPVPRGGSEMSHSGRVTSLPLALRRTTETLTPRDPYSLSHPLILVVVSLGLLCFLPPDPHPLGGFHS